jgi:hypothetical protein
VPPRDRTPDDPAAEAAPDRAAAPARKGRPTPKRREAEQARRRPLVPDRSTDRKTQRAQTKARREREYQAMMTGDDRHLPLRDKGPVRRFARDYVDARHSPGEYFLPVSLVIVILTFLTASSPALGLALIGLLYLVVFITVGDAIVLGNRLRKRLIAKFGAEKIPRGIRMYAIMRAFQIRRTRLPKPQVKRGEFPR